MSEMVPEGWARKKLSSMAVLEYGKSPNSVKDENGSFPIIGTSGLVGHATDFVWDQTSVVIGRKGTINKPIFIDVPFWAIDTTYFCKFSETTNPKWFFYKICEEALEKHNEASGVPSLSRETLKSIQLDIPPLLEQKKIASILTSVDDVIETTQRQIDKLQDLKKATMNELLTKGIGHTEFKDSELGRIPKSWEVVELKDTLSFISYGFTNPMPESEIGNFMVTAKDVLGGKISYETARKTTNEAYTKLLTDKSRPETGDILLTKDGTLGRLAIVDRDDICINQSVAVLRPNQMATSLFLFFLLSSPAYQKTMIENAGGSTIKHIYITVVDKMKVAIPKKEEQTEIVSVLLSLEKQIEIVEKKLHQTQSLKKSLMQDLLTGKVRVSVN